MARLEFRFYLVSGFTEVTDMIKSFTRFRGKQNYLDDYSGQQLVLTIKNDNNQVANFSIGTAVTTATSSGVDAQYFWVSEIQFNDQVGTTTTAGTGKNSTATIYLDDWMTRAGRIQVTNFALTQELCFKQIWNQFTVASGALPADMAIQPFSTGFFSATAATYTGTLAARINTNLKTEATGGQIYLSYQNLELRKAQVSGSPVTNAITLKPAKGASTGNKYVIYQDFRRISAGQNFINTVTVQPPVVAAQTATNSSSVTTYGARFNSVATASISISQAQNRAQWLANSQSNPNDLRYEVTFTDVMQDNTGVLNLLANYSSGSIIYLEFVVPGSGTTTTKICAIEGIGYSGTPDQTVFTLYLSPMDVYADFLLDSAVYGVLDQNRLGNWYV